MQLNLLKRYALVFLAFSLFGCRTTYEVSEGRTCPINATDDPVQFDQIEAVLQLNIHGDFLEFPGCESVVGLPFRLNNAIFMRGSQEDFDRVLSFNRGRSDHPVVAILSGELNSESGSTGEREIVLIREVHDYRSASFQELERSLETSPFQVPDRFR